MEIAILIVHPNEYHVMYILHFPGHRSGFSTWDGRIWWTRMQDTCTETVCCVQIILRSACLEIQKNGRVTLFITIINNVFTHVHDSFAC